MATRGRKACCKLCSRQNGAIKKTAVKSFGHLWSYFYHHQNVREAASPSLIPNGASLSDVSGAAVPKLSFTFSSGTVINVNDNCKEIDLCERCIIQVNELSSLHTQLETIKELIEVKVKTINGICGVAEGAYGQQEEEDGRPCKALREMWGDQTLDMSMSGSTTGKDNISLTLKLLANLCEGVSSKPPPKPSAPKLPPASTSSIKTKTETIPVPRTPTRFTKSARKVNPGALWKSQQESRQIPEHPAPPNPLQGYSLSEDILISPFDQEEVQVQEVVLDDDDNKDYVVLMNPSDIVVQPHFMDSTGSDQGHHHLQQDHPMEGHDPTFSSFISHERPSSSSSSSSRFTRRKSVHEKIPCEICGKLISQIQMQIHLRVHTGERPYECEFCQKRFSQSNSLKIHKRLHTGELPYECNLCSKRYRDLCGLRSHQKVSHKT